MTRTFRFTRGARTSYGHEPQLRRQHAIGRECWQSAPRSGEDRRAAPPDRWSGRNRRSVPQVARSMRDPTKPLPVPIRLQLKIVRISAMLHLDIDDHLRRDALVHRHEPQFEVDSTTVAPRSVNTWLAPCSPTLRCSAARAATAHPDSAAPADERLRASAGRRTEQGRRRQRDRAPRRRPPSIYLDEHPDPAEAGAEGSGQRASQHQSRP